jgi:NaMN:DMB phosphoribosyltransferase
VAAIAVALAGVAAFMYVGAVADNQGEALKAKLQQFEERIADLSLKAFGRK